VQSAFLFIAMINYAEMRMTNDMHQKPMFLRRTELRTRSADNYLESSA